MKSPSGHSHDVVVQLFDLAEDAIILTLALVLWHRFYVRPAMGEE